MANVGGGEGSGFLAAFYSGFDVLEAAFGDRVYEFLGVRVFGGAVNLFGVAAFYDLGFSGG